MSTIINVFEKLKYDKKLHGLFLNSLSLLEFAGARKIMKSQKAETINGELLGHMAEEIRHARVMKNMALKLSENSLNTYEPQHLLCGGATWAYIQTVDHGVEKEWQTPEPWLNYLYTTLIIEERAMKVYPSYGPILAELGFSGALQGLILEEENHLNFTRKAIIENDPQHIERLSRLQLLEQNAFSKFMNEICQFLS